MEQTVGFDNEKYIAEQASYIRERMRNFDGRLYIEFGGKLLADLHAARVLPGYDPNVKARLLKELQSDAEIIVCIHAGAIEERKMRADYGITYDAEAMRLIDDLGEWGLSVSSVVITRWQGEPAAKAFMTKLQNRGIRVYTHEPTRGYPTDIDLIVSDEGYGANPRIEVTKPLVVVTGPGPGSGKMATCLSQIYHDTRVGQRALYAKFETFPIWSLPLKHPVNIAYEAVDRHLVHGRGSRTAIRWLGKGGERRDLSYADLAAATNRFANALCGLGVQPGERVFVLMGRLPELYVAVLGALKARCVVSPLFSAFGEESLITRLDDAKTKAVLTTRKHAGKVRRIRKDLPELATIIIVDADDKPLARFTVNLPDEAR